MDNQAHICEQLGKANTFLVDFYDGFLITTSKVTKLKMVIKEMKKCLQEKKGSPQ